MGTFGTKFAADNWMHKSMGIQLGLTNSMRCQLPDDTDGTGYWTLTVHALGYQDYTVNFEATADNIVMNKEPVSDTSKLEATIKKADQLRLLADVRIPLGEIVLHTGDLFHFFVLCHDSSLNFIPELEANSLL